MWVNHQSLLLSNEEPRLARSLQSLGSDPEPPRLQAFPLQGTETHGLLGRKSQLQGSLCLSFPLWGWVPQEELGVRISKTLHLWGFLNQKQIERMLNLSAVCPPGREMQDP